MHLTSGRTPAMLRVILACGYFLYYLPLSESVRDIDAENRLAFESNKITGETLYEGAKRNPGQIYTTAIFPLLATTAQLALFSEGKTYENLLSFLNLKDKNEIRTIFPTFIEILFNKDRIGSPTLNLNMYSDTSNRLSPAFIDTYNKTFGGKARTVDYSDTVKAANEINDEVENEGEFNNIISSKMIKEGGGLSFISSYVLTIMYSDKFKFINEKTINFKSGNKVINIPGITGEGVVKYADIKSIDAKSNLLRDIFEEGRLELQGVSHKYNNTYVSSILHEVHLKPGPIIYDEPRELCSMPQIELEMNRPHLFYVTFTQKVGPIRTPIVGVVFDITGTTSN
ncbi:uncharacterized protein LOC101739125 isoform X2 [Bombyx mori]|uniref:uncharacterized protein LOC101739125 isoform X2 n=1 Tax=Bombyx mori TaxID=7091 RepID=UPI000B3C20CE